MSVAAALDLFGPGAQAVVLARRAFGGRGFLTPVRRRQPDGAWLGPSDAVDLAARGLIEVPYTFGEPAEERRQRLALLAAHLQRRPAPESAERADGAPRAVEILPVPVGEPQGIDTIAFFAACRLAFPAAHVVADLERLGHKLGQLCLSFGADEVMGNIVDQRELRLGPRAGSRELTRIEAAAMLRAGGFAPHERLSDGEERAL